jgi:hypothetical protein
MTEPAPKPRKLRKERWLHAGLLALILLTAAILRAKDANFGLPALNDPDEPLFMMTALDMLRNQTLNPGWFGHPGTITLYCLALVSLAVGGLGLMTGRFASVDAFAGAVYADPGIVFLPARLFIVACGVACVFLTYRIGARLGGRRLGLIASALLAVNAIHIEYSRIIRTDMQASVFMLLCVLAALALFREGKPRDYILAGALVGLAAATKWPAALIAVSPACASLWRVARGHRELPWLAVCGLCAVATLFIVSPFLLLDYQTVLRDLAGEARPIHPGATGGGFFQNLAWYTAHPLAGSLGILGLATALAGAVWACFRNREWAVVVMPAAIVFLIVISGQKLVWERWIVPLLPFVVLGAAFALCALGDFLRTRIGQRARLAELAVLALLMLPMIDAASVKATERTHDTRQIASAWISRNAPRGSTVLVEDAAIDLIQGGTRLLFPLGSAGCIDAKKILTGRIKYSQVETARSTSPIVDLGHMDMALLPGCIGDYALLTHFDRYAANPAQFSEELRRYRYVMDGARIMRIIRSEAGKSSGPVVYILKTGQSARQAKKKTETHAIT